MTADTNTMLYIETNFFSIAVMMIIALKSSVLGMEKTQRSILFSLSAWFIVGAGIFDCLWKLTGASGFNSLLPFVSLINVMYFACLGAASYLWFLYSEAMAGIDVLENKRRLVLLSLPLAALAVLLAVSMFNGCIFYFDSNMEYHRGKLFFIQPILSYGYIVVACAKIVGAAMHRKNFRRKKELLSVALYVIPMLVCGALQMWVPEIPVAELGITMSFMLLYINLLQKLISEDSLTGLCNRRELLKITEQRLHAMKKNERLFFLFVDIDSFKQINDRYGHNEGDCVLRLVASVLKEVCTQTNGCCGRYGGDEFAVVQVMEKSDEILRMQKEIYRLVDEKNKEQGLAYDVSLSIGCAACSDKDCGIQELIFAADADMYEKKKSKKRIGKHKL